MSDGDDDAELFLDLVLFSVNSGPSPLLSVALCTQAS